MTDIVTISFPASPDPDLDVEVLTEKWLTDDCHASHIEGEIVVSIPMKSAAHVVTQIAAGGWLADV